MEAVRTPSVAARDEFLSLLGIVYRVLQKPPWFSSDDSYWFPIMNHLLGATGDGKIHNDPECVLTMSWLGELGA